MKLADPYRCDECNELKQPSNGWLLAFDMTVAHVTFHLPARPKPDAPNLQEHPIATPQQALVVIPWDNTLADLKGATHLCSVNCFTKHAAKTIPANGKH